MKKLTAVLFLGSIVLALSACNTVGGAGKDIQKAGEAVEEAAK
jgi:predicted small secreted protein